MSSRKNRTSRGRLGCFEPTMKGGFPFRLGATSYILEDDLVPNCRFLGPLVDDIELVLFESDEISNLPDKEIIDSLTGIKAEHSITYTVHLPLDTELGSLDEEVRRRSVEKCLRVIKLTFPLSPFAYVVHFHGEMRGNVPARDITGWLDALDKSALGLLESGVDPCLLCVETLDYPFELVAPIVTRHGMSVCLDAGHLAFFGYPLEEYLDRYLPESRAVHLHGHRDGADHKDISTLEPGVLASLTDHPCFADDRERVLTLEVFGLDDFERSMETMRRLRT
ncbi:MAG: cobamide remodeling phosphodiesterase CbiR [Desulfomonilia bacterium]